MRSVLILATIAVAACSQAEPSERDIDLALAGTATVPRRDTTSCAVRLDAETQVTGVLELRIHSGPPGYGETPAVDARDTSWVLLLRSALPPCNAVDLSADSARREIQLVAPPANIHRFAGVSLTVYGRLGVATLGWERTPYVIFIDSLPALRTLAARRPTIL